MDLEQERLNLIAQFLPKPESNPATVAPEGTLPPAEPVVVPVVEPPKVELPPQPAVTEAPVAVIDPDAVIEDWDDSKVIPQTQVAPVTDFSEIAKALNLGDIKTKEELVTAVTALKIKAEAQKSDLPTLPEDLAKAVDIAKQGGNYLEYLRVSATDWSKEDPVILFQDWVYDRFSKSGKTAEEIEAYLDKIDDLEKEIRGSELQSQYIQYQKGQRVAIENQAKQEKQLRDAATRRALDSMDVVFGFKLGATHKEELFGDFSSTPMGNVLLAQAGGDYKKALERLFLSKYGEKVDAVRRRQLKDATKRELLQELTNPKITSTGALTSPDTKPLNPIDIYFSELRQKTGL